MDAMLAGMTAAQLGEWRAFCELEPFGGVHEDFRFAQLVCAVVNNMPLRGRGARQLKPGDVFRTLRAETRQSVADIAAAAAAVVGAMGGETVSAGREGGGGG